MELIKCDNGVGVKLNEVYNVDSKVGLKALNDKGIDAWVGSPPYSTLRKYGKDKVGNIKSDEYVKWFLPFAKEIYRVLKDDGIFVLNINNNVVENQEDLYIFRLVLALCDEVGFKFHGTHIWVKKSTTNMGGPKRARDLFEYIFIFYKEDHKFNVDDVRTEYTEASIKRYGYQYGKNKYNPNAEVKERLPNMLGALPTNVHYFKSARKQGNIHVAPYDEQLSDWFIKAFTDEGDVVLDTFMGSGTTGVSAKGLNRNYIGFDLVPEYVEYARERIAKMPRGKKLEEHKKEMAKRIEKTKKDIEIVANKQKERLEKKLAKEEAEREVS